MKNEEEQLREEIREGVMEEVLREIPLALERKDFEKEGRAANVALQQMRLCFRKEYKERKDHKRLFKAAKEGGEVKLLKEVVYKRRSLLGEEA